MLDVRLPAHFRGKVSFDAFEEMRDRLGVERIFVTLVTGRSGASLLAHIVKALGFGRGSEPFNARGRQTLESAYPARDPVAFIENTLRENTVDGTLYVQLTPRRFRDIASLFDAYTLEASVTRYSLLARRNVLAQSLSFHNAVASGFWRSTEPPTAPLAATGEFDPAMALRFVDLVHTEEAEAARILNGQNVDTYFYEDLVAATFETIVAFLAAHNHPVRPVEIANAVLSPSAPQKLARLTYAAQYHAMLEAYPWLVEILNERALGVIPTPRLGRILVSLD